MIQSSLKLTRSTSTSNHLKLKNTLKCSLSTSNEVISSPSTSTEEKKKVPKYYDAYRSETATLKPEQLKILAQQAIEKSLEANRKSNIPSIFSRYAIGEADNLPENPRELIALTGMPEVHQNRTVIIRNRPTSSQQSGDNYAHQWQIMWQTSQKWTNPLTGYISGADPMATVRLYFDSKEMAINYAEKNGWKYIVEKKADSEVQPIGWRGYKHNFLPKAVANLPKAEKKAWFKYTGYGQSHFFMPLKYHGNGIVSQHGGE